MRRRLSLLTEKIGGRKSFLGDIYFFVLRSKWWQFISLIFLWYLLVNLIFGFIYFIIPDSINPPGMDYFHFVMFSVQTISTVGYGAMVPASQFGHVIMFIESILGIIFMALITGLSFAKFSRPEAKFIFSKNILLSQFAGQEGIIFRVGNRRANRVVDAVVKVSLIVPENSDTGLIRRIHDLKLLRNSSPIFELSLTILIPLEDNPLLQKVLEEGSGFSLVVNIKGNDLDFSSALFDSKLYDSSDLVRAVGFKNILSENAIGRSVIDYTKFHDFIPISD